MFRRLQNLLSNQEENTRTLTNRLNTNQEFENKVKKFFGENEDFHKKKVTELQKQNQDLVRRLEESEKSRMEKVLEENDSTKVIVKFFKRDILFMTVREHQCTFPLIDCQYYLT